MVVFTKQELRSLNAPISTGSSANPGAPTPDDYAPVDEGEELVEGEDGRGSQRSKKRAAAAAEGAAKRKAKGGEGAGRRGGAGRGGRATFRDLQQRTLDEYMARM